MKRRKHRARNLKPIRRPAFRSPANVAQSRSGLMPSNSSLSACSDRLMSQMNASSDANSALMQAMKMRPMISPGFPLEQRGHKQRDDERRRQQRAERGEGDAQTNHPCAAVKDGHLRQNLFAFRIRAFGQFRLQQPRAVNGPAQPVGHCEQQQADPGNENHRTDGHLEHRNDFFKRGRGISCNAGSIMCPTWGLF